MKTNALPAAGLGLIARSLWLVLSVGLVASDIDPVVEGSWLNPGALSFSVNAVAVKGHYAYIDSGGLQILDISNPAAPTRVATMAGDAREPTLTRNLICVAEGPGTLRVIDIADPTTARLLGSCKVTDRHISAMAASGNYVYVSARREGIHVADISDPHDPKRIGHFNEDGDVMGIAISSGIAYLADLFHGLQVWDITNPANPQRIAELNYPNGAHRVALAGHLLCLAAGDLRLIDVTDPANPRELGRYESEGAIDGVAASPCYAYLVGSAVGLNIVDVSDPTQPFCAGQIPGFRNTWSIACSHGRLYLLDRGSTQVDGASYASAGLYILDVYHPANPDSVGACNTGDARRVDVVYDVVFVANGADGLRVVDVANPSEPRVIGGLDTPGFAFDVAVSGRLAYVADGGAGLQVLDISDPTKPNRLGGYDTAGWAYGVGVAGRQVCIADGQNGLEVIDVSDPESPRRLGGCSFQGYSRKVAVSGTLAYVADWFADLQVVDISDPITPTPIGWYDSPGGLNDVTLSDTYAYAVDRQAGLMIIDVSEPRNPRLTGICQTRGEAMGMALFADHALISSTEGGLEVIDVRDPGNPVRVSGNSAFDATGGVAVSRGTCFAPAGLSGLRVLQLRPMITSIRQDGGDVVVSWENFGLETRLQHAANLVDSLWQEVQIQGTTESVTLPTLPGHEFFRLLTPTMEGRVTTRPTLRIGSGATDSQ